LNEPRNVLVVGSGAASQRIISAVRRHPGSGRSIKQALSVSQFQEICDARRFSTFVREEFIDEVIIATPGLDLAAVIGEARHQRLDVTVVPEALGLSAAEQIAIENDEETTLLSVRKESVPSIKLSAKRALDVLLSGIGLAALLPLLMMIGIIVRLDSSGPALYRSFRVGCKRRRFLCYKFRTMGLNADFAKEGLRWRNERVGAFFKIEDDPRITHVGKFLRRYSLDELPQLWNVLVGEMSLVGPRPHPPDDINLYRIQDLQRLDFMPGITGLWQVTARQDPSFDTSVALDVEYIKGWSLWLDFQILYRTIGVVVRGSGS
jgi:exopolysaccharide biosynthesis polyprenyl glycosylphosphotransferase